MGNIRLSSTSMMVVEPVETSCEAAVADKLDDLSGNLKIFNAYDEEQHEWIERLIMTAEEVAEAQRIFLDVHKMQLTRTAPNGGRKSRRLLSQQDLVVMLNATEEGCATVIASMRKNPALRCIMSFNKPADMENRSDVLRSMRTPVLCSESEKIRMMPRIMAVIRNDEERLRKLFAQSLNLRNTPLLEEYVPKPALLLAS